MNDPFVHQLVGKIQSTLDDIKVSFIVKQDFNIYNLHYLEWFSGAAIPAGCLRYGGCHGNSPGTVGAEDFLQSGKGSS